jgi:hypothetical protein
LSEAQRSQAAAVQQLQASHAKTLKKSEASHAAAMSKVQTEAEAQLDSLTKQMEQLKQDVQAQLAERSKAENRNLKDLPLDALVPIALRRLHLHRFSRPYLLFCASRNESARL